jgi:hypothetical protein
MEIIPLYKFSSHILVGLDIDFPMEKVTDCLVVEIDIQEKKIVNQPWSGQKKLKFGEYEVIKASERTRYIDLITESLGKNMIIEIIDILLYPSDESIDSLVWTPARLKK